VVWGVGGGEAPPAGVGVTTALGTGTRAAYNAVVQRQMNKLDELIRKRSPLFQQRPAPLLPDRWDIAAGLGARGSLMGALHGALQGPSDADGDGLLGQLSR
jgi:hypothetical protein